jgi:hypothetical protein
VDSTGVSEPAPMRRNSKHHHRVRSELARASNLPLPPPGPYFGRHSCVGPRRLEAYIEGNAVEYPSSNQVEKEYDNVYPDALS